VLGALLFTIVALLFIALVLRTFSESSATLTEVASVAMQNNVEERLAISISYKQVHTLTASEASASVTVRTGSGSVDASLLDALNDGRFASIESAPVNAINSTGSPVAVAYAVELEVNSAVSGNCTITVAANSTVFIEIYVPAGQAWVLASKYYANTPSAWFNVTFSGSRALLYAYSTRPFKLMIDYLEVSSFRAGARRRGHRGERGDPAGQPLRGLAERLEGRREAGAIARRAAERHVHRRPVRQSHRLRGARCNLHPRAHR